MATTSAESYYKVGTGHNRAAHILYEHVNQTDVGAQAVFFAFYNVLGFAIELHLKAFLVGSGLASDTLSKKPFGHDLKALHTEAEKLGLHAHPGISASQPYTVTASALQKIVDIIGVHHGDYTYRYVNDAKSEYKFIKTMDQTFVIVDDLQEKVRQALCL